MANRSTILLNSRVLSMETLRARKVKLEMRMDDCTVLEHLEEGERGYVNLLRRIESRRIRRCVTQTATGAEDSL